MVGRRTGTILLVVAALLLLAAGLGRGSQAGALEFTRIATPSPGILVADLVNTGSEPITIAQVLVDNAYWEYAIAPSNTLPRQGRATISVSYPWVQGEPHRIVLLTSTGATFEGRLDISAPGSAPFDR